MANQTWYWSLRTINDSNNLVVTFRYDVSSSEFDFSSDGLAVPHYVYPTLYLKPTVKIISGTGSFDDAFEIAQVIK